jgi:hypothetical protein
MDTKQCSKCGEVKPLSEYHKRSDRNSVRAACKSCRNSASASYRKEKGSELNEKRKGYQVKYREENREKIKARRKRYDARFRAENKSARVAVSVKYKAAKLQRTASWANDQLIAAYYKEAKRLEKLTGIQFHVDHIIPLQGELVSGLHVETNLQLLPAHENRGKSNSFDPETFCA